MSCTVEQLHSIEIDGQKLGPFTRDQLIQIRREIGRTLGMRDERMLGDERVIQAVAVFFDVGEKALFSRLRSEQVAWARQVTMYFLRIKGRTFQSIGRIFHRDHGTVMHAFRLVEQRRSIPKIKRQIDQLSEDLKLEPTPPTNSGDERMRK